MFFAQLFVDLHAFDTEGEGLELLREQGQLVVERELPVLLDVLLADLFGALLLASVGIYGVVAYTVAQRSREIGIRMALGAQRSSVLKMVMGSALRLAFLGVGIGLAGALAVTAALRNTLYGVSATDPLTFAAVSALLLGIAALASWAPARRATRVDPMVSLRAE